MFTSAKLVASRFLGRVAALGIAVGSSALWVPIDAQALPVFARQTGQNCVACHAGGQFPELTPYGRMFKVTGYTIGSRTVPFSIMGLGSFAKIADTSKSTNPDADFPKDGKVVFATGSLFIAGKVSDNIGAFTQITYDNYATQDENGGFHGHSQADNMDFRYADHLVDGSRDFVYGVSLNNNPSVTDPWNTAAAWMQYVPVPSPASYQFIDGATPYPGFGSGGNIAGLNAYLFWNKTIYAEVGAYRSANGAFSFMSQGIDSASKTYLSGTNPYWRLAYSREWGAHNLMVGTSGMVAHVYDAGSDTSDPNNLSRIRNTGVDAQYQYILDPHVVTAQLAYMRQVQDYSVNTLAGGAPFFLADGVTQVDPNPSDTINVFRAKVSYVYQAKYGGSLAFFNSSGTTNSLNQSSGYDATGQIASSASLGAGNLAGNPGTRGSTFELFWTPIQYMRLGAQYTAYSKYNGASTNYDGLGRNASDNNSLFIYLWAAY